ncbi:DsbA family oxidoreductase [Mucilaginibacter sp. KACC 22063]|uniref:DsbA family oxidoreductase n=1 Tax=Mucilaginibacter sp. KACC 22063 TaxID=3025666 RepID=UPI002366C7D0|nr:DsbA family oxidoreductase [Mucilaginibacter sp. KACC 22063]WDF56613.1 DsbA family oxidoreductase [Mucilaginibacter sp. KACC 22063]
MKIEIWSDVMCPFCYIGKRRFEAALQDFAHKDEVEIEWKSFQLNPMMKTDPTISIHEYLAEAKGWTIDYARQLNGQVTDMAAQVGLDYFMDNAVVANSFNAHRLLQLAKQHNLGDQAEEQLFKSYFTLGKNIDDMDTLVEIGQAAGLEEDEIRKILSGKELSDDVHHDLREAEELGIRAVPFFVINRKYAVSGAQPEPVFADALQKAWSDEAVSATSDGNSCDIDGNNC